VKIEETISNKYCSVFFSVCQTKIPLNEIKKTTDDRTFDIQKFMIFTI